MWKMCKFIPFNLKQGGFVEEVSQEKVLQCIYILIICHTCNYCI